MNKELINLALSKLAASDAPEAASKSSHSPVHVVYGGAHMFSADTVPKLGRLALKALETYARDFTGLARAVWLRGSDNLPTDPESVQQLEFLIADSPETAKMENPDAFFAWNVFQKTLEKLRTDPIEDYRIDFEDGYGIRTDTEEDKHCVSASTALVEYIYGNEKDPYAHLPATGIRIKSFQPESRHRSIRTLELFMSNFLDRSGGRIPDGFVVALPKIISPVETETLALLLDEIEANYGFEKGAVGIEILIETPESIPLMREIAASCGGRCVAAHFGAYDYTSALGVSAAHQHLKHDACDFARNMMQVMLSPLGVRVSDSVTIEMPIPLHKDQNLSIRQIAENQAAVKDAWRKHFNNVTYSQINGFFQSWDLHPAQLVARYAAVYAFYLESVDLQAKRLRGFLEKATQAITTGNLFDDMASAEGLLNYFSRGLKVNAFSEEDLTQLTGLTGKEIKLASFSKIMDERFAKGAGN